MNKYVIIIIFILVILGGVFLFGKNSQSTVKDDKLQVSASFYPIYFFASQIGGEKVDVKNIIPAGAEPHDFEPSTQDMARMESSNLVVLNGVVEPWGTKLRTNLQNTHVKVVVAGEELLTKQITKNGEHMKDPHVWLNPILAKKEVAKITEAYISLDPTNKSYYKDNQTLLDAKLDELDARYTIGLQTCQTRDVITSHAAFAYLAEQYGLNQIAISGLSPDEEPSAKQLAEVVKFANVHNIKYIFFESLISPKLSETIANEVEAKTLVLDPIEGISDDDMKQGKNYFTVMENNLKNLQEALGCMK
jgi:zinc transport system substrate-binding protein